MRVVWYCRLEEEGSGITHQFYWNANYRRMRIDGWIDRQMSEYI